MSEWYSSLKFGTASTNRTLVRTHLIPTLDESATALPSETESSLLRSRGSSKHPGSRFSATGSRGGRQCDATFGFSYSPWRSAAVVAHLAIIRPRIRALASRVRAKRARASLGAAINPAPAVRAQATGLPADQVAVLAASEQAADRVAVLAASEQAADQVVVLAASDRAADRVAVLAASERAADQVAVRGLLKLAARH